MGLASAIEELAERCAELERAREEIEDLLMRMESIDLPSGIVGSHHAEMEWNDTLSQIQSEIDEIEGRLL
jgi:prefoldin subunit 5